MKFYSFLVIFFCVFLVLSCEKEENDDELVYSMDVISGSMWLDFTEYGVGNYRIETKTDDGEKETDFLSVVDELTSDRGVQGFLNTDGELLVLQNEGYLLNEPVLFTFTYSGRVEIFKIK